MQMNAITFDTLKFARTLQEQGKFTVEQSASLVEALGDVLAIDLTTKSDLRETELRLEAKIAESKADIIKWLFGVGGFQTLVILSATVALAHVIH
jgi:hypothetical protein